MSGVDLDWDNVRYFLRAVEAKTLAGAAKQMGIEQTTVGRRLTALERSLGAPLVIRGADELELTSLGEQLIPLAHDVERAVAALRAHVNAHRARVRLAVPTGFAELFIGHIDELGAGATPVSLSISTSARAPDLPVGEADLALLPGRVTDPELVVRKVADASWALYGAESYLARRPATNPYELDGHEVIAFDPSVGELPAAKWLEPRTANATIVARSTDASEMLAAALRGAGLAVLPCLIADREATLRRLTRTPIVTMPLVLAYRRDLKLTAELKTVIRFVTTIVSEQAARLRAT